DDLHRALKDKGIVDSECSRHMTENKSHLANYQEFKGGSVAFRGSNRRIIGKGKITAGRTLIEAARTMLADSFSSTTFWAETVNTACYVPNREANDAAKSLRKEATHDIQNASTNSTNLINTASTLISTAGPTRAFNDGELSYSDPFKYALPDNSSMPYLEDIYANPSEGIFTDSSYDDKDLPFGKKEIRTKWVYMNTKDEKGVVVRNKAQLVAQGHRKEEGIDYDEVFAHVARIKAIRIFLAFASYMGFIVYIIYVKSAFHYGTIDEEVVKTASTPIETQKPLVKDEEAADVDLHLYSLCLFYVLGYSKDFTSSCCLFSEPKRIERKMRALKTERELCAKIDMVLCALVPKQPLGMNLSALWYQQSFVFLQIRSSTSQVPAAKKVCLIQDDVQSVSIPTKPSTSKPHKKHKSKKQQSQEPKVPSFEPSLKHMLPSPSNDPLPCGEDSLKLKELMDLCTYFSNNVLELESKVIDIKSTYKERIKKLEGRVENVRGGEQGFKGSS
nr:putative ribonuclease H-like domain-containing protein [Tanacetum cinerariifolium]